MAQIYQSIKISKANHITFYDKKKLPPPPSILVTINGSSLTKVKTKRVLVIIIDEDLIFTLHTCWTHHTKNVKWHRLTLYPDLSHYLALQLYKAFRRSKLEFNCTVWGFMIHNAKHKHLKLLESAQRGAASLILRTMKFTPLDGLESELSILPVDLRLGEHQWHEVGKLLIDDYIWSNIKGRNKAHKMGSPFENLRSLTKQILQFLLQTKNCNVNQLFLPKETPASLEVFQIPNLLPTLPDTKLQ